MFRRRLKEMSSATKGSVVGFLLFIVHINDIHRKVLKNSFVNLFAEDMHICVNGNDFNGMLSDTLHIELEILYEWLC